MFHQRGPLNMSVTPSSLQYSEEIFRLNNLLHSALLSWLAVPFLPGKNCTWPDSSILEGVRWGIVLAVESCSVYQIIIEPSPDRTSSTKASWLWTEKGRFAPRVACRDLVLPPAGSHAPAYSNGGTSHFTLLTELPRIRTFIFTLTDQTSLGTLLTLHWNESDCPLSKPQFYQTIKNLIRG